MNLAKVTLIFIALAALTSCGADNTPDLIKFKSGMYGSKQGKFKAKFPAKPRASSRHYEFAQGVEFYEQVFAYKLGNEHVYSISYVDFPDTFFEEQDAEQLFDQSIEAIRTEMGGFRIQRKQINDEPAFEKSITYSMFSSRPGSMMKVKLLRKKNRFYAIYFACAKRQPNTEDIDNFLDSFTLYEPKVD